MSDARRNKRGRSVFEEVNLVQAVEGAVGCAWMVDEDRHETLVFIPSSRMTACQLSGGGRRK